MLKDLIKKSVQKLFPELAAGTHLPLLAVVVKVPDPPKGGEQCDEFTPKYAVDCRLLKSDFNIDEAMPLLRDVPVALAGAAPDRGFAMLPQPGTIVELAFAFGLQTHPYIRAVLPHTRKLPAIDEVTMRWQQTAASYLEVDAGGNWNHVTNANVNSTTQGSVAVSVDQTITVEAKQAIEVSSGESISCEAKQKIADTAAMEWSAVSPKIWLGSAGDNFLQIVSDFMATVNSALTTIAAHTHQTPEGPSGAPQQKDAISSAAAAVAAEQARTELIKK